MSLLQDLQWRYAAKKMNGTPVDESKIDHILEATRLAASSFGLQPYHILVIKDLETRKKLLPASYNQGQIVDCSHLLVFCIWDGITAAQISEFIADMAVKRNMPIEALEEYKNYMSGPVLQMDRTAQNTWSAKQVYLALGTALAAAAEIKVDSTPMEGFLPDQYEEILGLGAKGLKPVVIMAIGHRDPAGDWLAPLPKVRRDSDRLFERI